MIVQRNDDGTFTVDFEKAVATELEAQDKLAGRGLDLEKRNLLELEMEMQAKQRRMLAEEKEELAGAGFRTMEWMNGVVGEETVEHSSDELVAESGETLPEREGGGEVCVPPMAVVS